MSDAKADAREVLESLPDGASMEDVLGALAARSRLMDVVEERVRRRQRAERPVPPKPGLRSRVGEAMVLLLPIGFFLAFVFLMPVGFVLAERMVGPGPKSLSSGTIVQLQSADGLGPTYGGRHATLYHDLVRIDGDDGPVWIPRDRIRTLTMSDR